MGGGVDLCFSNMVWSDVNMENGNVTVGAIGIFCSGSLETAELCMGKERSFESPSHGHAYGMARVDFLSWWRGFQRPPPWGFSINLLLAKSNLILAFCFLTSFSFLNFT